jgi:hypothetical protein
MKQTRIRIAMWAGAALLTSAAWAQQSVTISGVEPRNFFFSTISEDMSVDAKPVAGAPYSADQSTTTTQTLADGNHIVHTSSAKVYRDEQGRTRIEHTLENIGPVGTAAPHTMVTINDPVAGVHYALQPENHTAQKMTGAGPVVLAKQMLDKQDAERMASAGGGAASRTMVITSDTVRTEALHVAVPDGIKSAVEDLGAENMEGLNVKGTRTTITIPAGAEGNERPMQIVDERWYSPDLQANIKTIHTDPRMGETVFTVTNVSRSNPDASLFQVPADYQISEGPGKDHFFFQSGGPVPPPPPPPPPPAQ